MKEKIITILIFDTIVASFLYFGLPRINNFSGVDEPYWSYGRVPNFWHAIATGRWKSTNICDKPGITIAAISGIGLPFLNHSPKELKPFRYEQKTPEQLSEIEDLYFHLRLPVLLFTLLIIPVFYFLIKKLLGSKIANFATIFIGLSPILMGIAMIINSDAMLWILTALATLSLFVFFENNQRKFLLLSGFFLGLSVITKYVANVLFVYFFLVFLLEYLLHAHKEHGISKYLKQAFISYLILFVTALATAFVFFPATWVKFSVLINATVGNAVFSSTWPMFAGVIGLLAIDIFALKAKISQIVFGFFTKHRNIITKSFGIIFLALMAIVFLHVYAKINYFDLQAIVASPKGIGSGTILYKYLGAILADIYSLVFSISPLILACLIFAIYNTLKQKQLSRRSITAFYIIVFVLIFYLGSTVNAVVTTVRYQIMTYPLVFVLAAIGLVELLENNKIKKYIKPVAAYPIVILVLLASLINVKPNFLAYASEILPDTFIVNLKGMGDGSAEAAKYLNSLPNAHDMTIWADKGAVCERFVGKCYIDFKPKTFEQNKFDYIVVSTDRKNRTLKLSSNKKESFAKVYNSKNNAFEIVIDNNPNDFVKVVKAENILGQ